MTCWWDEKKQRYRSNLPYKIMYRWGWRWVAGPALRMLPAELASHLALRMMPIAARINALWEGVKLLLAKAFILVIILLIKLPWFTCELIERSDHAQPEPATREGET